MGLQINGVVKITIGLRQSSWRAAQLRIRYAPVLSLCNLPILTHTMNLQSDIYSLGIAVIEMCENTPPYKQLQKPKKFSNELHDFINQCLLLIPNKRPDATQLLHVCITLLSV